MSTRARGRASAKNDGTGSAGAPGGMGRSGARSRAPDAPSRPPHESTMRDLIEDQPAMEGESCMSHRYPANGGESLFKCFANASWRPS